ncbi:hypothetical protein O9992_21565 [Vibrio lentus]|nr:hypothetical protein [Vibrio lentus]
MCGAFDIQIEDGRFLTLVSLFGGMAATPKRGVVKNTLLGKPWTDANIKLQRCRNCITTF